MVWLAYIGRGRSHLDEGRIRKEGLDMDAERSGVAQPTPQLQKIWTTGMTSIQVRMRREPLVYDDVEYSNSDEECSASQPKGERD